MTSKKIPVLWSKIAELVPKDSADYVTAKYQIAEYTAMADKAAKPLQKFLTQFPDSPYTENAYMGMVRAYHRAGDLDKEADTYKEFVEKEIAAGNESPGLLNGYAWHMTEIEKNLNDALMKVQKAVAMLDSASAKSRAQVMDTEGEVLWKLGKIPEAAQVEQQCIELQPDDAYYQKQKAKFLQESKGA